MFHSQPLLSSMPTLKEFIIHPPLPLNPRKSQQLLNIITTSFRKQLDAAHGGSGNSFRADFETKSTGSLKQQHTVKEKKSLHFMRTPTDLHLSSILTNPLFNTEAADLSQPKSAKDPMRVFQMAVSKGMMTTHWAKLCLTAKKNEIIQSPILSVRQGMRESGAGLKVLKWLGASGMTDNNHFLSNWSFTEILMEFIVAEELQEVAWKWIKRSFDELPHFAALPSNERTQARRNLVRPLMLLIKAETFGSTSLDSAYLCLSRAAGYLKVPREDMILVLGPPGSFLSRTTTSMTRPESQPVSESAFDSFLGLIPVIFQDPEYHFAHLYLHHPSHPSAALALPYLHKMDTASTEQIPAKMLLKESAKRNLIQLGLDTAKFLFERDQLDDAEWVMAFLQQNLLYGDQLLEQAKAEASSLQLLEGLSLA